MCEYDDDEDELETSNVELPIIFTFDTKFCVSEIFGIDACHMCWAKCDSEPV